MSIRRVGSASASAASAPQRLRSTGSTAHKRRRQESSARRRRALFANFEKLEDRSMMAISITSLGVPYTQNFDSLVNTGSSTVMPAEWLINELPNNATYTAGTGSSATGDTYSFGATGSTERALGGLDSNSLVTSFGTSFVNNTGGPITGLNISYTGEQWRLGALNSVDRLDFKYSLIATSISGSGFEDFDTLDFTPPNLGPTLGALDGNLAANRTTKNITIPMTLAAGSTVWIRWDGINAAGNDDGLAIDDLSVTALGPTAPTFTIADQSTRSYTPVSTTFNVVDDNPAGVNFMVMSSSNTTAIPLSNVVITGSGTTRTVTVTPNSTVPAGGSGTSTITIRGTDSAGGLFSEDTFDVTVVPAPLVRLMPVTGQPGDLVQIPVRLYLTGSPTEPIRGIDVAVLYDSNYLTFLPTGSSPGPASSNNPSNITVTGNSNEPGKLSFGISWTNPLNSGTPAGGTVYGFLNAVIKDTAPLGTTPINMVKTMNLNGVKVTQINEGAVLMGPDPTDGVDVNDTLVTVTAGTNVPPVVEFPPGPITGLEDSTIPVYDASLTSIVVTDDDNGPLGGESFISMTLSVPSTSVGIWQTTEVGSSAVVDLDPDNKHIITISGYESQVTLTLSALDFIPAANTFGTVAVSVTTTDLIETLNDTFDIIVGGVNDAPSFTIGGTQTAANDAGLQTVSGFVTNINKGPNEAAQTVSFTRTSANSTLFSVQPAIDANGTLTYTPAPGQVGSTSVSFTMTDSGGGPLATTAPQSFTINITAGAGNIAPVNTFPAGPVAGVEDTALALTGGNLIQVADSDSASVTTVVFVPVGVGTFAASANGSSVTPSGSGTASITFTGAPAQINLALQTLVFTPALHRNNTDPATTITVNTNDGAGGIDNDTFNVNLAPVNDQPSFTVGTVPATLNTAGQQTIANFATINKGAPNESGQTVTFTRTSVNSPFFSVQPAIDANGTLTFTPAVGQNGTALVSFTMQDNGGGTDTSTEQSFLITITAAVNQNPVNTFPVGPIAAVEDTPLPLNVTNIIQVADTDSASITTVISVPAGVGTFAATANGSSVTPSGSGTNSITFTGAPGQINLALQTLVFSPTPQRNDAIGATLVNIATNDGAGGTDSDSFTINVAAVNDVPSFAIGGTQTSLEDAGLQTVNGFATAISAGGGSDENGQTLTFNVNNNNTGMFLVQPSIDANGVLTYRANPDANGTAQVTVTLSDNGVPVATSASQQFTINITAVNDTPSFTIGGTQTSLEDAGLQTVNGFATAISAGAANESQTLTFNVSNNNTTMFLVQPSIDAAGVLTYRANPDANGTAQVTVTLSDNGVPVATSASQQFTINITAVNDTPSFTIGGTQTSLEDAGLQTVNGFATAISTGAANESQTLTFNVSNNNTTMFLVQPSIDAAGVLTYRANPDANGTAQVTVTLSDNGVPVATSASQQFTINITAVNDTPSFTIGGTQTSLEDAGLQTVNGFATAISAGAANESQTLTFNVSNNNTTMFLVQPSIDAAGVLTYRANPDANGTAQVTVTLSDNGVPVATSAAQQFTINITAVNDTPSFTTLGSHTVLEDAAAQSVSGFATANAGGGSDENGQTFTYNITANTNGALFSAGPTISPLGVLSYTPAANAWGSATITVSVTDSGIPNATSNTQQFTINLTQVNDAPTFTLSGNQMAAFNAPTMMVGGFASAISPGPLDPAQVLTFQVTNNNSPLFSGQPTIANDGTLTYTPMTGQSGTATVTVRLMDNGGTLNNGVDLSAEQTFTITIGNPPVNLAPTINPLTTLNINEDAGLQTIPLSGISAGGAETQNLTVTASSNNAGLTGAINVAYTPNNPTGSISFTPVANANGTAIITVTVTDAGVDGIAGNSDDGSTPVTLTVNVAAVNDTPSFVVGGTQTSLEDAGLQTVNGFATAISAGAPNESQTLTFNVSSNNTGMFLVQPSIDAAGVLTYQANPNANGSALVTVTLSDNGTPVATSAAQQFTINITAVNDTPSFTVGVNQSSAEDAGLQTVNGFATAISTGAANESQTLTFNVSNNNTGLFLVQPAIDAAGVLTYRANPDMSGSAQVTVTLSDNGTPIATSAAQQFTITITAVNDAPTFVAGANPTILEDAGAQTINSFATGFSPGPGNDAGQTLLNYLISNVTPGFFSSPPSVATNGTLTYTVAPNMFGNGSFELRVRDNGGTPGTDTSAAVTVTITVTPVNDVPVFSLGVNQTVSYNAPAQSVNNFATGISSGAPNETQELTFEVLNNNNGLFSSQPTISSTGTLQYTPMANTSGTATVTVRLKDDGGVSDGGVDLSAAQTFTITVAAAPVNALPTINPLTPNPLNINEDASLQTINLSGITAGGAETQNLIVSASSNNALLTGPINVSYTPNNSTGSISFTPVANANGTATITVTVTDTGLDNIAGNGDDGSTSVTLTVNVAAVNDTPSFVVGPTQTSLEDAGLQTVNGFATAISTGAANESQTLTFNVSNNNTGMFLVQPAIDAAGVLTYQANPNANGSALVTVTLSDNGAPVATSAAQQFTINITAVNDTPSFTVGPTQTSLEDAGLQTVNGFATAISTGAANETQTLTFNVSNNNTGMFLVQPTISSTGVLTYRANPNANGTAEVTVTLSDNGTPVATSAAQQFTINITAVNDTPSFVVGGTQISLEDAGLQTVNGFATAISTGAANESQTLTFNVSNNNTGLFLVQPAIDAAGVLTYQANPNANGSAQVTVTLSDDGTPVATSAAQQFTINITAVNDTPSFAVGPNQTSNEDAGLQTVSNFATSISTGAANESQTLTFNVSNNNTGMFLVQPTISSAGVLTYRANPNANGTATVTVTLSDNGTPVATSAAQQFTITVNAVNDVPVFTVGGNQTIAFGSSAQTVVGFATGISAGPSNESTQNVQFNIVGNSDPSIFITPPAIAPNGTLTYTPSLTVSGTSTITVNISDDGGTDFGGVSTSANQTFTITITAQPVNNPPTINTISPRTINEDAGLQNVSLSGITAGAGGESQPLTVTVVSSDPLIIPTPSLSYVSPSSTGSLTFTPVPNAFGTVTITVTVRDTGLDGIPNNSDDGITNMPFTVTVNPINDTPTFTPGANQTVNEDAGAQTVPAWTTAISAGPANEAGQALNFTVVGNSNPALFAVAPAISPTGELTYTPAPNAFGSATISYRLSDDGGGAATTNTQSFIITVNPVNDAPSFTAGANQSANEDAGQQMVAWATALSAGPSNENGQALSFNISNNSNPALFSVQPTVSPTGVLSYTPALNAVGVATITLNIVDNGGIANGGVNASGPQTFTITVNGVNDRPSFTVGASQTVNEDAGPQTVDSWATAISAGPSDEAGQALTFNVTGNSNPLLFSSAPSISPTGVLTYTPAANAFGSATITVTLSDDGGGLNTSTSQTFNITVNPVNDAPSFVVGANQMVNEDAGGQSVSGFVTGLSAGPANESSQQVTVNVTGNSNPTLFSSQPTISAAGTLSYTPAANASGVATITVTVSDNGGTANGGVNTSAPQTFTITVNAVNDNPTFTAGSNQSVNEDAGLQTVNNWATGISAGPADEAGQALAFLVTGNSNPTLFSSGPSISATGTLTFTPAPDANGSAVISVQLNDNAGGSSVVRTFTINVAPVNDAPLFTTGANQTVPEDAGAQSVAGWATGIAAGPANESSQSVTFNVTGNSNSALFSTQPTVSPSGVLSYTPAANASGMATITLVAVDNGGTNNGGVNTSGPQTFTISVTPVNDAPDAADSTFTTSLNTPLNATVVVNDPDGPTLTYAVIMPPALGVLTSFNTLTGAFTYAPNTGATGLDLFTFSVSDGTNTDTATVRISIQSATPVVTAENGNIQVVGTSVEDTVIISRGSNGQALVRTGSNGFNVSAYYPLTGTITVSAGEGRDYIVVNGLTNPTIIDAGAGDDYAAGGMGDDTIIGGPGNDQINASGGNNVVWGDEIGQQDLAVGGDDKLSGTSGNDVMYGGGGNDQIFPGEGDDYVYAGQGNDMVSAAGGNDRIFGGAGNDTLAGDSGDDIISGGGGNDLILGRDGNDVLIGGTESDSIDGSGGNDLLVAGDTTNGHSSLVNDANDVALLALLTSWNSTHGAGIATGILAGDDGVADSLTGGTGDDDFYALLNDTLNGFNTTGSGTDRRFP